MKIFISFHKRFLLNLHGNQELETYLHLPRFQRAIGVIYNPETERASHYFFTRLPYQLTALFISMKPSAVQPLDIEKK